MIFRVRGLRQWSRTLWRSAEGIRRARILTFWTGRFCGYAPALAPASEWQGTMRAALLRSEAPVEEPSTPSRMRTSTPSEHSFAAAAQTLQGASAASGDRKSGPAGPVPTGNHRARRATGERRRAGRNIPADRPDSAASQSVSPDAGQTPAWLTAREQTIASLAPADRERIVNNVLNRYQTPGRGSIATTAGSAGTADTVIQDVRRNPAQARRANAASTASAPNPSASSTRPSRSLVSQAAPSELPATRRAAGERDSADAGPAMPPGVGSAATATGVWREILTKRIERRLQTQLVRSSLHIESQQTFDVLSAAIGQEFDREMNGVRMSFGGEFAQLPGNETSGSEADSESWHNPGGSTQESEAAGNGKTGASGVHRAAAAQARRDSAAAAENPLHTVGLSTRDSAPAPDVALSVVKGTSEQSLTRVFPPSASPTMPPLIADRVTQPPAFGLSAPVTRQATRSEDVDVNEDDLAELSSKIQLILREEARRFGIAIP